MAKRKYKVRTGAKTAAKAQERELVRRTRRLRDDPELIFPKCTSSCPACPFPRIKRSIERIRRFSEDEKALTRFSKRGDQISRAYAAALIVALSGKAPYLARLRTPAGEVAYAMRGKVKKEKLVGVQNYHDPRLRLISIADLAHKRGIHKNTDLIHKPFP